jgi:N-acetylmuramoyl-L-alanine amidase
VRRLFAALIIGCAAIVEPALAEPTADAVRVMALNMYHEARGEGRAGMLAVGWVVLNRMADPSYPATVREVVYQGCQFSWVCDHRSNRPHDGRAWRKALKLAAELLSQPSADPTRGALWYHANWVRRPNLGAPTARVARIGQHLFYARAEHLRRPPPKPGRELLYASR